MVKVTVTKGTKSKNYDFDYAAKTFDDAFFGYLPTDAALLTVARYFDGADTIVIHEALTETVLEGYSVLESITRFKDGYQIKLVKG